MPLEMCGMTSASVSRVYTKHGGSSVNGTTNIMASSYTPPKRDGALRITIALTTSRTLYLTCTDGTTAYTDTILGGGALTAATWYSWIIPVSATSEGYDDNTAGTALSYNLQMDGASVVRHLYVSYIAGLVF